MKKSLIFRCETNKKINTIYNKIKMARLKT